MTESSCVIDSYSITVDASDRTHATITAVVASTSITLSGSGNGLLAVVADALAGHVSAAIHIVGFEQRLAATNYTTELTERVDNITASTPPTIRTRPHRL